MKKITMLFLAFSFVKAMANDISWSFPPQTLSTNALNASDPQIAMDPNGNLIAAWIENGVLKSRSKILNSPWSSLNTVSSNGASSPKIVTAFNGAATALWVENGIIKTATKALNSGWTSATVLSNLGATSPSLAIDITGDVVAVWARNGNIESVIRPFGGNWSTRTTITSTSATMPEVSFGGNAASRSAIVVWQALSNASPVIYASSRTLSAGWTAKQIISDTNHFAANPHVDIDNNGNAIALWYAYDQLNNEICNVTVQSANYPFQGAWTLPTVLSEPGVGNPLSLTARIAYDGLGNAMALWNTSFDNATFTIQTAIKPIYGAWLPATNIIVSNTYAYEADFSLSAFGNALSAYMFYNGNALLAQATESNTSGFLNNLWSAPTCLSTGNENGFPRVTSTVYGNSLYAASVWVNSNGPNNTIVSSIGSKNFLAGPTNLSVVQQVHHLGFADEYYNAVSWQASSDPSVIGYLVYRNTTYLDQVNALQYIDNNQPQNGPVVYGIAAINADNTTSKIMNVSFP